MSQEEFFAKYCIQGYLPGDYEIIISGDREGIKAIRQRINNYYTWLEDRAAKDRKKHNTDSFNPK
jgi:hypothetical protein